MQWRGVRFLLGGGMALYEGLCILAVTMHRTAQLSGACATIHQSVERQNSVKS